MLLARQIHRLLRLTRTRRSLLICAGARVVFVRLALWLLPFRSIRAWAQGPRSISAPLADMPAQDLAWAVRVSARCVPRANCLTQALALQSLLAQAGRSAKLQIAVAKRAAGGLDAHAWIECDGKALGEPEARAAHFMPLAGARSR